MEWWLVAVCVTFVGTSLAGLGLCLQKYAHKQLHASQGEKAVDDRGCACPTYCCHKWWFAGIVIFLFGHILCFAALGLGTQSVLSCVNCWCLVVTFVIAPTILGESVTVFRALSVLFLIFGCTVVIMYGPRKYSEYNVELLHTSMHNHAVIVITASCASILLFICVNALSTSKRPRMTVGQATLVSAMLGWYSVLTAKCTAGFLWTTLYHRHNQFFTHMEPWVLISLVVGLGITNLHFLNLALEYGEAIFVIPLYEALAVTGQIFIGGIFFNEFNELSPGAHMRFWFGVTCVICGVIAVSSEGPEIEWMQQAIITPPGEDGMIPKTRLSAVIRDTTTPRPSRESTPPPDERSQLQSDDPVGYRAAGV